MNILRCKNCGKMFKIVNNSKSEFITDLGGRINCNKNKINCICCKNTSDFEIINCDEWVADKVFSITGD